MIKKLLLTTCIISSISALTAAEQATNNGDLTLEGVKQLSETQMQKITGENVYEVLVYSDGSCSPWVLITEDDNMHDLVIYRDAETGEFIKTEHYYNGPE